MHNRLALIRALWRWGAVAAFGALVGAGRPLQAAPALETAFTYQGYLTLNGTAVEGACEAEFQLYAAPEGGAPIGPVRGQTISAVSGLFETELDFGAEAFTGEARWLAVSARCPAGQGEWFALSPRQALRAAPYALYARQAPWAGLLGVPAGFADGVDAVGVYTAGAGLQLAEGEFRADLTALQARLAEECPPGSAIRAVDAQGAIACEPDADTRYTAGAGLTLTDTTFSADATLARQADITPTVAAAGFITRTLADERYTLAAGAGLQLAENVLSVDTAAVQTRIAGGCPAGQSIRAIAANGAVTCELDDDTNSGGTITAVTAGAGLTGGGANGAVNLAVDTAAVQTRIAGSCPAGQSIRAIAANGAVTCELDDDTNSGGTITAVTAGAGLSGGGANGAVTLAVNPAGVAGTFVILTAPHTAIVNNPGASVGAYSVTLSPYGLADAAAVLVRLRCWFNEAANLNDVCYVGSGAYGTIRNGSLNFDDRQFVVPVSGGWLAWGVGGATAAVMVVVDVLGYWR